MTHGWKPETGFLPYRWEGYDEALLLYVLGLGSPTHPLPQSSYAAWASTYRWESAYGQDYLYAGPLFIHQLSHLWIPDGHPNSSTCGHLKFPHPEGGVTMG